MNVIYCKPFLRIGRLEAVSSSSAEDDPIIQKLALPPVFAGVSREHAEISWNEDSGWFELKVVGRNGCVVNRKRFNQQEVAPLPVNEVSTFSLGKNCFVYFAPAKQPKSSELRAPEAELDWTSYVTSIFEISDVDRLPLSLIVDTLVSSHGSLFEGQEVQRKRALKSFLRRPPFRLDAESVVHYAKEGLENTS
jgi:hypothetical protein